MAKHYLKLSEVLQKLLYDKRMNASELAREVDLPTPTVHRMVTGKSTRPYRSSLQPIADYFAISVDQLLGEEPLPTNLENNRVFPVSKSIIEIPLLDWTELGSLDEATKPAKESIVITSDLSDQCFAVCMNDASMEPNFAEGSVLVFDPGKQPYDRCFVLAKLSEKNIFVFRHLLMDAEHKFLKPLNPDLIASQMRLLEDEDSIIAVLVEARQAFMRR